MSKKAVLKYVEIQSHSYCNAKCLMCPYPYTSKYLPMGKMEDKLFEQIINELVNDFTSLKNISIMLQNEPLLDKDIQKKIALIAKKRANFKRKFKITTTTNGVLLTKKLLLTLEKAGLDILNISLTPTNNNNRFLSPGINFSKVFNKIKRFPKLQHLKICLRMVVTNKNFKDIIAFIKKNDTKNLLSKNNLELELQTLSNRAGTLKTYNELSLNPIKPASTSTQNVVCPEPFNKLNILFNGDVIICCHDWKRENILGNIKKQPINRIWNNKKFQFIRKMLLKKQYNKIRPCNKCSVAKYFLLNN